MEWLDMTKYTPPRYVAEYRSSVSQELSFHRITMLRYKVTNRLTEVVILDALQLFLLVLLR